jgi:hypothetical protein
MRRSFSRFSLVWRGFFPICLPPIAAGGDFAGTAGDRRTEKNFFSLQDRQVSSESLNEGVTREGLTSGFARND